MPITPEPGGSSTPRALTPEAVAGGLAAAALLIAGLVLLLPARNAVSLQEVFTPEHVVMYHMFDTGIQRRAHWVALTLVFGFAGVGAYLARAHRLPGAWTPSQQLSRAFCVLKRNGGLVGLIAIVHVGDNWSTLTVVSLVGAFCLMHVLSSLSARRPPVTWPNSLLWLVLLAYISILMVPGFTGPLDLSFDSNVAVTDIEAHYTGVLGPGSRIAAGFRLFDGATPYYSISMSTAFAALQQYFGPITFGSQVRIVQWLQLIFCALAALSYYLWKPRAPLCTVVPLLLVAPFLCSLGSAIWFPPIVATRNVDAATRASKLQVDSCSCARFRLRVRDASQSGNRSMPVRGISRLSGLA
jgi:hypothetical protein